MASQPRVDLTVLGATGFTAKAVIEELCTRSTAWLPRDFSWAIAGRNAQNLEQVRKICEVTADSVPPPEVMVVDVNDKESLLNMATRSRLVLNCVGPYRKFGEPVVEACILGKCDYLDLTGEPEFIESMVLKYYTKAKEAGVTICHSAAFDSVPCDMAVLKAKQYMLSKGVTPSSVEMFLSLHASSHGIGGHFATFESAVLGFGASTEGLKKTRQMMSQLWPRKALPVGPKVKLNKGLGGVSMDRRVNGWTLPYFFSDPAVVRLTQTMNANLESEVPPVHFAAYLVVPHTFVLLLMVLYYTVFQVLVGYEFGCKLLLAYPGLFTHGVFSRQGPTPEQMAGTSFTQNYFLTGYSAALSPGPNKAPDVKIHARITGPEPGYAATPVVFIFCARVLLEARDKVAKGVVTPAVAFEKTELIEMLSKDGRVVWGIVSDSAVAA